MNANELTFPQQVARLLGVLGSIELSTRHREIASLRDDAELHETAVKAVRMKTLIALDEFGRAPRQPVAEPVQEGE